MNIFENKKVILMNPITGIPKAVHSHIRGFELIQSFLMNAKILYGCPSYEEIESQSPDIIALTMSVNYKTKFGIIGGLSDKYAQNIKNLTEYVENNPNVLVVNLFEKPENFFYNGLTSRIGKNRASSIFTEDLCNRFCNIIKNSTYINMSYFDTETITVGDSHTPAFTSKGNCSYHHNGKTLFGAMKMPLSEFVKPYIGKNTKKIEICLGSTDIRHHVLRDTNIYKTPEDFVIAYKKQCEDIEKMYNVKVVPCAPVGVEHESRVIPEGNTYKGTPFTGSVSERRQYTKDFIDALKKHFDEIVIFPEFWYDESPEDYASKYMERPRSVHLSPMSYRSTCQNWDNNLMEKSVAAINKNSNFLGI